METSLITTLEWLKSGKYINKFSSLPAMKGYLRAVIFIALLFVTMNGVLALDSCLIHTNYGPEPDFDCDGVIDVLDNCPDRVNAEQWDMNRNGVGDACDLLIEEVVVNPDNHLKQGEFAQITARLINNREYALQNVDVTIKNMELQLNQHKTIAYLPVGEAATVEFWHRIPKCANTGRYTIDLDASFVDGHTFAEVQSAVITVEAGDVCGSIDGPLDDTIINVFGSVDINDGEPALYPISIANLGDQATYHFTITGLDSWGTWRIDPAASITLPAGHDSQIYLYLQPQTWAPTGVTEFNMIVTSEDQQTTIPMKVYLRRPYQEAGNGWLFAFQVFIILLLLGLIIAAIVIAAVHVQKKPKEKNGSRKKTKKKAAKKKVALETVKRRNFKTHY